MAFYIFLLLLAVPLIEIALFITVGDAIGLLPTLTLVVLTAVIGSWLIRRQGLKTVQQARANMDQGIMPVQELFDGLCLFVAGITLLTPGFFTDALGLLLLTPPVRRALGAWLQARLVVVTPGHAGPGRGPRGQGPVIIETDYEDITDDETPDDRDRRG